MNKKTTLAVFFGIAMAAGCSLFNNDRHDNITGEAIVYQKETINDIDAIRTLFKKIENSTGKKTVDSVFVPLNELDILIDKTANKASLFYHVHPNAEIRTIAEKSEQEIAKLATDISLSRSIYEACTSVDVSKEDSDTQRLAKRILRDFKRAGVNKPDNVRMQIKKIQEELVKLSQEFSRNIREDVRSIKITPAELSGLPKDYIDVHKPAADGLITITTDYPDYIPFMQYANNDRKRLELYKVFRQRSYPKNKSVLKNILIKRYELATLLDYRNFAEYETETRMIKTASNAQAFIDKIAAIAEPRAKKDYEILLKRLQKTTPEAKKVGDWQKMYLSELVKQEQYQIDSKELREYFQSGNVRNGIINLVCTLFDVKIRPWDTPVWHKSVKAYEMFDGDRIIGRFYLDLYPRDNKYKHAAHFSMISGIKDCQVPVSTLVCNFTGENDDTALMEHDQVLTFLHEFGHMLHHLFSGNQRWIIFSGISTELDFLEAPSQMLEEWTWDADILKKFAKNHKGEVIPNQLVEKMVAAKDFGIGLDKKHQMFYAALSLNYYNCNPCNLDLTKTMQQLQNKYAPYDYVPDTYFYTSFGHLDGYSAMYYSYMWAEVIAKDMFSQFKQEGMLNPSIGKKYRNTILEPGGSKDAVDLVKDFLGRPYSFEPFARWLGGGK
ncbi:MAG: Zn-dependent oligopeptidase [Kiritimatiellae bacterium]|nr:Zn-dependent oligopeptidase [Kiritimatiellia bacterium]MDD5520660.1 Zn-dependent oligopeptidase [Kiritimatiellia bacterium]